MARVFDGTLNYEIFAIKVLPEKLKARYQRIATAKESQSWLLHFLYALSGEIFIPNYTLHKESSALNLKHIMVVGQLRRIHVDFNDEKMFV